MAPHGRRIIKSRKTHLKKKIVGEPKKEEETENEVTDFEGSVVVVDSNISPSGCSTPKGQKFRIPESLTCPPAPKKQRVISNCSSKRSPIAFFSPPDLELFFLLCTSRY